MIDNSRLIWSDGRTLHYDPFVEHVLSMRKNGLINEGVNFIIWLVTGFTGCSVHPHCWGWHWGRSSAQSLRDNAKACAACLKSIAQHVVARKGFFKDRWKDMQFDKIEKLSRFDIRFQTDEELAEMLRSLDELVHAAHASDCEREHPETFKKLMCIEQTSGVKQCKLSSQLSENADCKDIDAVIDEAEQKEEASV